MNSIQITGIPKRGKNHPCACLLGDISMVRALGKSGIRVAVATAHRSNKSTKSRYCKDVIEIPGWLRDPEGTLHALTHWAKKQAAKPVLFYQTDADLIALSQFRDPLAQSFRFVLPEPELVHDLVDKSRFYRRAGAWGIPIPDTRIVNDTFQEFDSVDQWASFPCVLKPITRSEAWHRTVSRTSKAVHINTRGELISFLERLTEEAGSLVLQSCIRGGEENVLSYHAYVREDSEIVMEFTGRKIRTSPRQYGFSTYLEITDDEEVRDLGRDVVNKLGFRGVLKIDFKRDRPSGKLFVLEINPRFNLWHHPGLVAGVPIPEAVYWNCVDPTRVRKPTKARKGVRWMSPRHDIRAYGEYRAENQLTALRWIYEAMTVDVNEGFQISDPGPAIHDGLKIFRRHNNSRSEGSDRPCK